MLLIVRTVRLPPENLDKAHHAMQHMIENSRAENGCIEYSYAEDVLEPGLIHLKEIWDNRAALDRHFTSTHITLWRSTWASLGITDRNLKLYDVGEPTAT